MLSRSEITVRLDLLAGVWLLSVAAGFAGLGSHEFRPGASGVAPPRWPAETRVARASGRPIAIMALHPQCPCSRASLDQLSGVLARAGGLADIFLLVSGSSRAIAAPPGAVLLEDPEGTEAARFGAATSGHVTVYDAEGRLAFSGGITPSRGHRGSCDGQAGLLATLRGGEPPAASAPVFGCPLRGSR